MHTLYSLNVTGLVQGVGFRPYVEELGNKLNLKGSVSNIGGQVLIKIFDDKKDSISLKKIYQSYVKITQFCQVQGSTIF